MYDHTGRPIDNSFLTSCDGQSVRTQLELGTDQTAVVKKVPMTIEASVPVNLHVDRFDADEIRLTLAGTGDVQLKIRHGPFAIVPGSKFDIDAGLASVITADVGGALALPLKLTGETRVRVSRSTGP